MFDVLAQFGWDCRQEPFYPLIDACRLIVNVYKHGKGRSLDELATAYPEYLRNPLAGMLPSFAADHLDHEWPEISEEQFVAFAGAFRAFWTAFPERLFYEVK